MAARALRDRDENERRVERDRHERVHGETVVAVVAGDRHDADAGAEPGEGGTERLAHGRDSNTVYRARCTIIGQWRKAPSRSSVACACCACSPTIPKDCRSPSSRRSSTRTAPGSTGSSGRSPSSGSSCAARAGGSRSASGSSSLRAPCGRGCRRSPRASYASSPTSSRATTALTIRDGDEAVAAVVVQPAGTALHVAYRPGLRHPVDRAAPGIAILAGAAPRKGERPEVGVARKRGWSVTTGELLPGATGVAAPIDGAEASISAVWIDRRDAAAMAAPVVRAAAAISAAL